MKSTSQSKKEQQHFNPHSRKDPQECDACDLLQNYEQNLEERKKEVKKIKKIKNLEKIQQGNDEIEEQTWEMKPPDSQKLGRSSWTLLHTMAAYYPQTPSQETKEEMKTFLNSFSKVYPCSYCAKDFQDILKDEPPQLDSQFEFSQVLNLILFCLTISYLFLKKKWMCRAHNRVNAHLMKPMFDCSKVDQRWKRTYKAKPPSHKGDSNLD